VNTPAVLIADEPTGNLDPKTSWEIMNLLDEVNQRGTTVLVATHEKYIVDAMKKRVISLERGTIISDAEKGHYEHED
jgi:cell division transport system ATP-binding protein